MQEERIEELLNELCSDPVEEKVEVSKLISLEMAIIKDSKKRSNIVEREFKKAGIRVKTQRLSQSPLDENNVIGIIQGKTKEEIIICAHHDRFVGTPGADDNASGLLTLIDLAYSLNERYRKPEKTIKLISFGGEEAYSFLRVFGKPDMKRFISMYGFFSDPSRRCSCLGSKRYVRYYPTVNTWGVINLDLCGRDDTLTMVDRDAIGTAIYNHELAGTIRKVAWSMGIYIDKTFTAYSLSDNRPFAEKGVRTVWLTRVNAKNMKWSVYHSKNDLPEMINTDYIIENKRLLEAVVDYFQTGGDIVRSL